MLFALGYIAGLVTSVFIAVVLLFFKAPIMLMGAANIKKIELAGVREKGGIFMPRTDADEAREEIIKENAEKGADTPISELM